MHLFRAMKRAVQPRLASPPKRDRQMAGKERAWFGVVLVVLESDTRRSMAEGDTVLSFKSVGNTYASEPKRRSGSDRLQIHSLLSYRSASLCPPHSLIYTGAHNCILLSRASTGRASHQRPDHFGGPSYDKSDATNSELAREALEAVPHRD